MMYNDNILFPFEDEINPSGRTEPRPFEQLKLQYLIKLSGKCLKTPQNVAFYHLVDNVKI